ncbi:MAG: DUF4139 domain-containing protein [Candidatus Altiarchaeota archaeon]
MKRTTTIIWMIACVFILGCVQALSLSGDDNPVPALYQEDSGESVSEGVEVTVYNSNLGIVKQVTKIDLSTGLNTIPFAGVASSIDTTSVKLKSLDGSFSVLEQNYQYDLVSKQKLLEKFIDKKISGYKVLGDTKELVEGVLLAASGNELILKKSDGGLEVVSVQNLMLPQLPEGLITKPTLEWLITSSSAGSKVAELSYMTSGMTWRADYVAVVNKDDSIMDLNGWVTVNNNAGTAFQDAKLKLVAGDVNRAQEPSVRMMEKAYAVADSIGGSQFAEEQLFEYHMYDLQRKTTLKDREQKQISLLAASGTPVEKEFIYENQGGWWYSGTDSKKIQVKLNFKNSEGNGLGMPLPKGLMRVFKKDSQGKLQFIGEDSIDHTPKDETIRILMGNAFDVVGERKQMNVKDLGCQYEVTWQITLRNHKEEDVVVTVLEDAYWDWEIVSENYEHIKESNEKIKWRIPVKKDGESILTYKIRYNHC